MSNSEEQARDTPGAAAGPIPAWTYWVVEGHLLAGPYPREPQQIAQLLAAGIRSFLDLTEPGQRKPYDATLPEGIVYLRAAIRDFDVPSDAEQMRQILGHIRAQHEAGHPVYLHCNAGIGRTGTVAGCWLVEAGFPGEEALIELNRLWKQSVVSRTYPVIPATEEQRAFVRRWPAP